MYAINYNLLLQTLGQRLKGNFKSVMAAIKALTDEEIQKYVSQGYFEIEKQRVELEEVRVIYCISGQVGANFEAHSDNEVLVLLDMTPNEELLEEGLAREVINRVQKLKKKAQLIPTDPVLIYYELNAPDQKKSEAEQIQKVMNNYHNMIKTAIKSEFGKYNASEAGKRRIIINESVDLKGINLMLTICSTEEVQLPQLKWINLALAADLKPRFGRSNKASLLLEDSKNKKMISYDQLKHEIDILFGIYGLNYNVFVVNQQKANAIDKVEASLSGKLLVVSTSAEEAAKFPHDAAATTMPYCKFANKAGSTVFTENPLGFSLSA